MLTLASSREGWFRKYIGTRTGDASKQTLEEVGESRIREKKFGSMSW